MNDTTHPTTPDQGDERRAIIRAAVAAMPSTNPLVADDLIEGHTMHTEADDIVAIWKAAQRAAAQPVAQEAIAWSLRFDDDPRLNLSTIFDTEGEAKNYAARCGSATPVPLYAAPHHPADEARMLRELLARIHRDGGHYIAQHGLDKAVEDADLIVSDLLALQQASAEAGKGVEAYLLTSRSGQTVWTLKAAEMTLDVRAAFEADGVRIEPLVRPSESVAVSGEVSDEQLIAADTFSLAWMAPRGKESVVAYGRAVLALAGGGGKS